MRLKALLLGLSILLTAVPVAGQEAAPRRLVEVGAGVPGVLDDSQAATGMLTVRFPGRFLAVSPMAGVLGATQGQLFAFVGGYRDLSWGGWTLTPMFSVGAFEKGQGRDLGSSLQFRSALEFARHLPGGHSVGVQLAHISNGGLGWRNPGQERLLVTWLIPF